MTNRSRGIPFQVADLDERLRAHRPATGRLAEDTDKTTRRQPHLSAAIAPTLPALVLLIILSLDWTTAAYFHTILWIVLVPGLAALLCSLRVTVAYAFLCVAVYLSDEVPYDNTYSTGWPGLILIAVSALGAIAVCAHRVQAQQRAAHIRHVARTTRRTVLRPLPSQWAGLEQAASYTAADVAARVGGDFYDIQPSAHGTRLVLGDVQGKGLGAVATAAALAGSFREAAYYEPDLAEVALRMDRRLTRHRDHQLALGHDDRERFATAALIAFPAHQEDEERIELVNCGHLQPLAVSVRGVRPLESSATLPLGLLDLGGTRPPVTIARLAADETLLLVSDGVTEARDDNGTFFPLSQHLDAVLSKDPGLIEPKRLVHHIRDAATHHTAHGLTDDTTVLAVRRIRSELPSGTREVL
ncbi:PP2C family protein-serine/threonine phosphatase [Streptomyces sp. NPDC055955]|uniref:PP2C family protein-serine/threonine phosphatase n=1 Tax=Streptomyces sp. NPDC055955 TaxID=3345665 RepID=UPI0035DE64F1